MHVNNVDKFIELYMACTIFDFTACLLPTCIGKEILAGITETCDTAVNTQCGNCGKY